MRDTMAVLLAGGRGRGMSVLTEHRATAAVPFAGKYRLVDFSLSNCHHSELSTVGLITQHAPTSLHEHVGTGRPWSLDRHPGGVTVLQPFALRQRAAWYAGAADALLRNLSAYEDAGALRIVVGSAEHVYLMDYSELVAAHQESRCPVTAVVGPLRGAPPRRRHMVEVRGDRVVGIEHNPERTSLELACLGIFVFELDFLRAEAGGGPRRSMRDVLEPTLARGLPVHAFHFGGFWEDVRELSVYYETSMALLGAEPPLLLGDPLWPVETLGEERPAALFLPGSRARDSLVASGAVIEGEVESSILFGGAVVEHGARVTNSILMQEAHVGRGAVLDRAVLDKMAGIGDGAVVGHGGPGDGGPASLCVIGKEARVPAGHRLPRGACVPPPAHVLRREAVAPGAPR